MMHARMGYLVVAVLFGVAACGGSSAKDAGANTVDAKLGSNGDGPVCAPIGGSCNDGPSCCTGACNVAMHMCVASGCLASGMTCGTGDQCCTDQCVLGKCGITGCAANGATCAENGNCCSDNCAGTTCAPVAGATCVTIGNTCGSDGDCCSLTCSADKKCIDAGGVVGCRASGDICFKPEDCCTGSCSATATSAGTCKPLATYGSGGCHIDGEPCTSGENCCSRICAAIPGAGTICQVASGCRLIGDVCHKDSDCCGGAGTMALGEGEVTCNIIPGTSPAIGTCSNPNGCDPEGDVCGLDVNARHDCCGCDSPKINCCKLDSAGVPRCYGSPPGGGCPKGYDGTPGCCIPAGDVCTFSSECCNGVPCLPDSNGLLHCAQVQCVAENGQCTATGDCCTGLECIVTPGANAGVCKRPVAPPPPDGGVAGPDASVCALTGQTCSDTVPCCPGYNCDLFNGTGPCNGGTGCTCYKAIP